METEKITLLASLWRLINFEASLANLWQKVQGSIPAQALTARKISAPEHAFLNVICRDDTK